MLLEPKIMRFIKLSRCAQIAHTGPRLGGFRGCLIPPQLQSCSRRSSAQLAQCSSGVGSVSFSTGHSAGRTGSISFVVEDGKGSVSSSGGSGKLGRLQQQLKALGLSGVLAYGLFNTLYYTCAFLFIWIYVVKVPSGLGPAAAARKFVEVFALTWVGSQVSKAARAGGALLLAPAVDRGLAILEDRLKLRSRQQAFLMVIGCCLAFALLLFCGVVVAWS